MWSLKGVRKTVQKDTQVTNFFKDSNKNKKRNLKIYVLYLIYINVGYFFISSFDNFQDNFDHFIVIGIQLYKNKKTSKPEKMLPAVRWLHSVTCISTEITNTKSQCATS